MLRRYRLHRSFTGVAICASAENDATTASITSLAGVYQPRGIAHRRVIYPAFIPENRNAATGAGHQIFSAQGVEFWKNDVLEFLDRYLNAPSRSAPAPTPKQ